MSRLRDEIQQRQAFASREEEAFLNLLRTSAQLSLGLSQELRPERLTLTQYNVLRILRGSHPQSLSCGELSERMVTPDPDITRLLDRLERRRLVKRGRDRTDRRVVRVAITQPGLTLLARLDSRVDAWIRGALGHLGERALERLSQLLERARHTGV